MNDHPSAEDPKIDFDYHRRTYRAFVRWVFIGAAHVAVILLILAYTLSDNMG